MRHSRYIRSVILGALILSVLAPAAALGIARDTVLARGKVWVDKNVPYSQTRYARIDGRMIATTATPSPSALGYRTDCSGFVSMCLGITYSSGKPLSRTTRDLYPSALTTVSKAAVLPGDVVLRTKQPGHTMIFVGWADDAKDDFIAYEERGSSTGTVRTVRDYSDSLSYGYRLYRYKKIDDFYVDCQQTIYGTTRYETAVAATRATYPATSTAAVSSLVVASGEEWPGNLGGAAIAGAGGGPLLLVSKTSLPATTSAAIKRLAPKRVYVMGDSSIVSTAVASRIASLGVEVVRVQGKDRFVTAAEGARASAAIMKARKKAPVDTAYLVGPDAYGSGLAAVPAASKTGRPILLTHRYTVPAATLSALKTLGIKRIYVVGSDYQVSRSLVATLKKRGFIVSRLWGPTRYHTALVVAQHSTKIPGAGLGWSGLGVSSGSDLTGLLTCAVAQGQAGSVMLSTPGDKLFSGAASEIAARKFTVGKVRVYGSFVAVELPVRTAIAKLMRAK
ncbi:MAG: hypothetical protein HGB10_11455 [Coriobacteriia bacterium]|nr:hypothetical protein [Coriobacteriia bacterium]